MYIRNNTNIMQTFQKITNKKIGYILWSVSPKQGHYTKGKLWKQSHYYIDDVKEKMWTSQYIQ